MEAELEARLFELQERNRRLVRQAVEPFSRAFEGTTEEEPLWTPEQARRRARARRRQQQQHKALSPPLPIRRVSYTPRNRARACRTRRRPG